MKALVTLLALLTFSQSAQSAVFMCDYYITELYDAAEKGIITMDEADKIYRNCNDRFGFTIEPTPQHCNCMEEHIKL